MNSSSDAESHYSADEFKNSLGSEQRCVYGCLFVCISSSHISAKLKTLPPPGFLPCWNKYSLCMENTVNVVRIIRNSMFVHCVQVGKMKTDLVGGIINLTFPPLCQGNESLSLYPLHYRDAETQEILI